MRLLKETQACKLMSEYMCEFLRPFYIAFLQMSSETLDSVCVIDARHSLEGVLDYKWLCTVGGAFVFLTVSLRRGAGLSRLCVWDVSRLWPHTTGDRRKHAD